MCLECVGLTNFPVRNNKVLLYCSKTINWGRHTCSVDVCKCGPSDLSNIINVINLAYFNHHLSCNAALHRRLCVQQVRSLHTHNYVAKTTDIHSPSLQPMIRTLWLVG